ncbi:hypothetical protein BIW11_08594, partial [Tropilaelaps mercedesae]
EKSKASRNGTIGGGSRLKSGHKKKKRKKGSRSKGKRGKSNRGSASTESLASVLSGSSNCEDKRPREREVMCSSVLSTANLQGSIMKCSNQNLMGSRLMGSSLGAGRMGELGRLKSSQLVAKPNCEQSIKRAKPGPMLRPMPTVQTTAPPEQFNEEDCGYQQ